MSIIRNVHYTKCPLFEMSVYELSVYEMSVYEMSANLEKERLHVCIIKIIIIIINNKLLLLLLLQARFACLSCAAGGLLAPRLTLINYKVDNISKYVCLTIIIDITRKITKFVN